MLITPGDETLTVTDTASGIIGSATVTITSPAAPPGARGRGQAALLDWLFGSLSVILSMQEAHASRILHFSYLSRN
jgi:hypothetical protein